MAGEVRRAGAWTLSVGADPAARRGDTREVKVLNKEASFLPVPYKWESPSWGWVEVLPRRRQRGTRCGAFLERYMVVFFPAVSVAAWLSAQTGQPSAVKPRLWVKKSL